MMTVAALFHAASTWPVVGVDAITDGAALILAPHPDDESLGCGGLIAESCARGQPPLLVVLTDGAGSHPHSCEYPPSRLRDVREQSRGGGWTWHGGRPPSAGRSGATARNGPG